MDEHMAEQIRDFVQVYCTPISLVLPDETGALRGTASLLELNGCPYLLTCDHIARERSMGSLAIGLGRTDKAARLINPILTGDSDNDIAVSRLPEGLIDGSGKKLLPSTTLANSFSVGTDALLMIHGFPGFLDVPNLATRFYDEHQVLRVQPFAVVASEGHLPSIADARLHFAVPFTREQMLTVTRGHGQITPHGLSGAPVWDTGVTAAGSSSWSPDHMRFVGMAIEWVEAASVVICLRIEIIRRFLLRALQLEAAYFRWCDRGRPVNDEWADWFWAESTVQLDASSKAEGGRGVH
jgi:hypothetical protein